MRPFFPSSWLSPVELCANGSAVHRSARKGLWLDGTGGESPAEYKKRWAAMDREALSKEKEKVALAAREEDAQDLEAQEEEQGKAGITIARWLGRK